MKIKLRVSYIFPLVAACILSACTSSPTQKNERTLQATSTLQPLKQEIAINIVSEPQSMDPRKARSLSSINLVRMFNDGLTRLNKEHRTELALASHVSISEDLKTYTFNLKKAYWSNGDPVTAHDFIYSWKKSLSPNFPSDNAFHLFPIKNSKDIKSGTLPSSFLGATAIDDYTLVIELEYAVPYFLDLLSLPIYFPINAKHEKEYPHWSLEAVTFISNGPFKLQAWEHTNEMLAVKNETYWDASQVKLESIKLLMVDTETGFRMFEANELQWDGSPFSIIPTDAIPLLKKQGKIEIRPFLGTAWIRTNIDASPCQSQEIRQALAKAIDRQAIVDHITQGIYTPATGIVPDTMGIQEIPYFKDHDVMNASSLLIKGLQRFDMGLEHLPKLKLTYLADPKNYRVVQAIQDQWREHLGIDVELEPLENKVYFDRIAKRNFQLAYGSWIADFNDPINFLEIFKSKNIGTNNTNWESPNYAEALQSSYICTNQEERKEHLRNAEKLLIEEMPVIPIYHYAMIHMKNKHLQDIVLSSCGHIDFKWAYLSGE